MYKNLSKKDRKLFIIWQVLLILGIIGMFILALVQSNVQFVVKTNEEVISVGIGFFIALVVLAFALLNRASGLLKFRSLWFIISFIVFLLLMKIIEPLVYSLGYISIPLLIDDFVMRTYFKIKGFIELEKRENYKRS